jgi:hypothetical protein
MNLKLPTVDTSKIEALLEDIPDAVGEDIENATNTVKDKLINEGLDKTNEMTKNPVGKFILNKLTDLRESLTSKEANAVDPLALQRAYDFSFFNQPQMYQQSGFGNMLLPLLLSSIPMIQQSMMGNNGNTNAAPQTGVDSDYTYYVPEGTQITDADDIDDSWGAIAKDGAKQLGGGAANLAKEIYIDTPMADRMMGTKPKIPVPSAPKPPPTTRIGKAYNAVKTPIAATHKGITKVLPKSAGGLAGLDMAIDMGKHIYDLQNDPSIAANMRNLGANAIDETRKDVIEWQRKNPMFSWVDPTITANIINANRESWDAGKDTFREIGDSIVTPLRDARKAWNEGNYWSALGNTALGGWEAMWAPARAASYIATNNPIYNSIKGVVNYGVDTVNQLTSARELEKQYAGLEQTRKQAQQLMASQNPQDRARGLTMMENYNKSNYALSRSKPGMTASQQRQLDQDAAWYAYKQRYGHMNLKKQDWNRYQAYRNNSGDMATTFWDYTGIKPQDKPINQPIQQKPQQQQLAKPQQQQIAPVQQTPTQPLQNQTQQV